MRAITDLRSKVLDGLLPGVLLFLVFVVSTILVRPIEYIAGRPGAMIYALALLAISIVCLERAVNPQVSEVSRAMNGMAGGGLTWVVVEISIYLGSFEVGSITGGLIFITIVLITATVWHRGLPMGIQYFGGTLILLWGADLVISSKIIIASWTMESEKVFTVAGWLFLALAAISVGLVLFKSRNRLERVWGAVLVAFFMILALFTFQHPGL
ncbi:MAG TPA: hypothetical protein VLH85_08560 [Levilinea sp.]|nr:hypothetical protein [Levilinea sp.]